MKRWNRNAGVALLAAVWLVGAAPAGQAMEGGTTADGRAYLTGGIGLDEREALAAARKDHSLQVITAARGSGAFLSNVALRITDGKGQIVLERPLAGPQLLVDLAPGRYTIEADLHGQVRRTQTQIAAQGRREVYFYFDVVADVLPRDESAR